MTVSTASATGSPALDDIRAGFSSRGLPWQRGRRRVRRIQTVCAGSVRQHVLEARSKVVARGNAGLTTGTNEHDTVSVLAAVAVILCGHKGVLGWPRRDGDNDEESR